MGNTKNHQIKVYQFVDSSKIRNIDYFNSLINCDAKICFDLEDSIKVDANTYHKIRISIFNDILELIKNNKVWEVGIRINSTLSDYYSDDILQISKFSSDHPHINIFLPKISDSTDIVKTVKEIVSNKIQDFEVIPIIESIQGMNNLSSILSNNTQYISKVAFGHCDFNYDCNYFPFHHQDSENYWNWVKILIDTCGNNFIFLNSPYLNLNDDDYLVRILSRLKKATNKSGQITLSLRQSKVCRLFNQQDYKLSNRLESIAREEEVNQFAMYLVNSFEQYKVDGKNFAIIPDIKKLISPQEYAKAKEIIMEKHAIKN